MLNCFSKYKIIFLLALVLLLLTSPGKSQERSSSSLSFEIDVITESLKISGPFVVNLTITNDSDGSVELRDRIDFHLTKLLPEGKSPSPDSRTYYAPFSISKTYVHEVKSCQNNLLDGDTSRNGGALVIKPLARIVDLGPNKSLAMRVDVSTICWGWVMSSFWPHKALSQTITPGKYELYGVYMDLESNKIQVEMD